MPIVAASALSSGSTIEVRPDPAARRLVRAPPVSASPSGDAARVGTSVVSVTRILPEKAHSVGAGIETPALTGATFNAPGGEPRRFPGELWRTGHSGYTGKHQRLAELSLDPP